MQFSRVVSFFLVFMTIGLFAFASPVAAKDELQARAGTPVTTILHSLESKVNTILPEITKAGRNQAAIVPLLVELIHAVEVAVLAVDGVVIVTGTTVAEVAGILSVIVKSIALALVPLTKFAIVPEIVHLLAELDLALKNLLFDVNITLSGVTALLSKLLVDVGAILAALSFTLITTLLAL